MNADPVSLVVCFTTLDHITGSLHLTVGVRDKRRHVTEESYAVLRGPGGLVVLAKEDGTFHELRAGGSCSCDDAKYRRRAGGCKHVQAARLAGLFDRAANALTA